jgi:hypothetical protein
MCLLICIRLKKVSPKTFGPHCVSRPRNLPSKLCVGIPLSSDFVFNGITDLYVRVGLPDGSASEHCRLETCTCWVPDIVLRSWVVFIS